MRDTLICVASVFASSAFALSYEYKVSGSRNRRISASENGLVQPVLLKHRRTKLIRGKRHKPGVILFCLKMLDCILPGATKTEMMRRCLARTIRAYRSLYVKPANITSVNSFPLNQIPNHLIRRRAEFHKPSSFNNAPKS
jgi:hypothetical protein